MTWFVKVKSGDYEEKHDDILIFKTHVLQIIYLKHHVYETS